MGIKYSKSDRTRKFIIESASSIFNIQGYAGRQCLILQMLRD
jgi:hypothetical protein